MTAEVVPNSASSVFPRVPNAGSEPLQAGVERVPSVLPQGIANFCCEKGIHMAAFFRLLWSIALRPFVNADQWSFGFQDLRGDSLRLANQIQVIQSSLLRETSLASLFQSENQLETACEPCQSAQPQSTAVFLLDELAEGDASKWLDKHRGFKHDYFKIVLTVEFDGVIPKALRLLYHLAHFTPRYAALFASTISEAIQEILADPNRRIGDLDLMSPENRQQIKRWNNWIMEREISIINHRYNPEARGTASL